MLHIPLDEDMRFRVYGPYTAKDGRRRVVIREALPDGTFVNETRSYPKYLVECALSEPLESNQTVDHVDRNFTNDDPWNLKVINLLAHTTLDAKRVRVEEVNCPMCGTLFTPTKNQRNARDHNRAGPFCSRKCSGSYGADVQNGGSVLERTVVKKTYYTNKETE